MNIRPMNDPYALRLGVNIDHIATVRNARGGLHPDPVRAALLAQEAGADGITAHLREDRRHIRDADISKLKEMLEIPLNFEMAATDEMVAIALAIRPHAACLVPEKREERTTEGGLDAAGGRDRLWDHISRLADAGIRVSLFIEPEELQLDAAVELGTPVVELHTGTYCDAYLAQDMTSFSNETARIAHAAKAGVERGLEVHAGHGLSYDTVRPIAAMLDIRELNIGHFLMGEAMFVGMHEALSAMRSNMAAARSEAIGKPQA